jgi:hypothetical protein
VALSIVIGSAEKLIVSEQLSLSEEASAARPSL